MWYSIISYQFAHWHFLPFIYSCALCFRYYVSYSFAFVTIKILFCHFGHSSQRSWFPPFHHFKRSAACRMCTEWIREKGSDNFFPSCCICFRSERKSAKNTKAFCCVYIWNYFCNKLQLNERDSVGNIYSFSMFNWKIKGEFFKVANQRGELSECLRWNGIIWSAHHKTD